MLCAVVGSCLNDLIATDSPMETDAFMTFGLCVNFLSSHAFPCGPELVSVELEVD